MAKISADAFLSDVQEPQKKNGKISADDFLNDVQEPEKFSIATSGTPVGSEQGTNFKQNRRNFSEQLPELIGSTAAGIATATLKTPIGAVATGGGAMLGEIANQLKQSVTGKNPPSSIAEAGKRNVAAFARGAGGELIGRGIGKLFTPFSGSVTPEISAGRAIAEREGIKAPVSNLVDNRAVQLTEKALEYSPFGGSITRQKLASMAKFREFADNVGGKIGADTSPEVAGALAKEQTMAFKEAYDQTKEKLYDLVMPKLKKQPVALDNTIDSLERIIARRSGTGEPAGLNIFKKWLSELKPKDVGVGSSGGRIIPAKEAVIQEGIPGLARPSEVISESVPGKFIGGNGGALTTSPDIPSMLMNPQKGSVQTFEQLRKLRTNVGARGKFNDPAMSGLSADVSDLYGSISKDLDKVAGSVGDDVASALKQADDFYMVGKNTLKSKVYKALTNAPQTTMHRIAFVAKSPENYDLVKEIVGKDTMKDMAGQWYNDVTKNVTSEGILSPRKLLTSLEKYDGTLQKLSQDFPEIGQKIGELRQVAKLLSTGKEVAGGSQTTPSMLGLGAMYATLANAVRLLLVGDTQGALTSAGAAGGQAILSGLGVKGIQSDFGRKLLTTGFPKAGKFAGRIAQVGGQIGLEKASE